MKSKSISLLLLISFCFITVAKAQEIQFTEEEKQFIAEHPIIEFGYSHRWEPYEMYAFGQYGGIVNSYLSIIEEETGIDFQAKPGLNWKESLRQFDAGEIKVIAALSVSSQRKKKYIFSEPYLSDPIILAGSKENIHLNSLSDLNHKTVAVIDGFYSEHLITEQFPNVKIKRFKNMEKALLAIIDGEADVYVGNLNIVNYYINYYGFDKIRVVGATEFSRNNICVGIHPDWEVLKGIIDKVLLTITPEKHHEIRKQWMSGVGKDSFSLTLFLWSILITIGVIIILILGYFWNRLLKKKLKIKHEKTEQLNNLLEQVKQKDQEKKILLQEIHHRVKNNLQIVSSILNLQSNYTEDKKTQQALKEARERVSSIALFHQKMYQSTTDTILDLKSYVESLFDDFTNQYPTQNKVELNIETCPINSKMKCFTPIALIINELISNSLNHAFHSQEHPKITISFTNDKSANVFEMNYTDNGKWIENKNSDHFGTSMIEIFTEQMDGEFEIQKREDSTSFIFKFHDINFS